MNSGDRVRPLGRWLATAALLVLGGAAASRLPLEVLPAARLPEVGVDLALPLGGDLDELARRWLVPIESAVRSAGDVRTMAGRASASGAEWRVRLAPGSDVERKAARMEAALRRIRAELPRGASLRVRSAAAGASLAAAIVVPEAAAEPLREELELLDTVEWVDVAGRGRPEQRIRVRPGVDPDVVGRAVDAAEPVALGEVADGARRRRLWRALGGSAGTGPDSWEALPVALPSGRWLALGELGDVAAGPGEPRLVARVGGRAVALLLVAREPGGSPLELDRQVREVLARRGIEGTFLVDEARRLRGPLRRILAGLALGSLLAGALAAALHPGRRARAAAAWLAAPWAGAAGAAVLLRLADRGVDLAVLPQVALGLVCGIGVAAVSRGVVTATTALVGFTLPGVALAVSGGAAAPLLGPIAGAWASGAVAGLVAVHLVPFPEPPARGAVRWVAAVGWTLRRRLTWALGAGTFVYLALLLLGDALQPLTSEWSPRLADIVVETTLPDGTTLADATGSVGLAEARLAAAPEVISLWSLVREGSGQVFLDVAPEHRSPARLGILARRLEQRLAGLGGAIRATPLGGVDGAEPLRLEPGLGSRPETDPEATFVRVVLRATDLANLTGGHRAAAEAVGREIGAVRARQLLRTDWAVPEPRIELVPRPGADPGAVARAERALAAASALPAGQPLAGGGLRRVVAAGAPEDSSDPPALTGLLGSGVGPDRPVPIGRLFEVREVLASPSVRREDGRFALPVTVGIDGLTSSIREDRRRSIVDRIRRALPPGVELEAPDTRPRAWTPETLRLAVAAATLPLLALALAAVRLAALWPALAAVLATLPGLAVALAAARALAPGGRFDELVLLAVAGVLATGVVAASEVAARMRQPAGPPAGYRWLVRGAARAVPLGGLALGVLAAPGLGLDPGLEPWTGPLWAGAATGLGLGPALVLVLPGLVWPARRRVARDGGAVPGIADRDLAGAEGDAGPVLPVARTAELEVRNVTKIYPGGVRALFRTGFHLRPGITGLLGPNGAGKTTLLRMLCGILEPSRGRMTFAGRAISADVLAAHRARVGYLPQEFDAWPGFTVERFLGYWARQLGVPRGEREAEIERVLAIVDLGSVADRRVRDLSGGMRRRIGIARALLGDPPVLVVDEPTTGLDVPSRRRLREALLAVAEQRIVVFSTHIASDVATVASRLVVLDRGRPWWGGGVDELIAWARGRIFEVTVPDAELGAFARRYRITTRVRTVEGVRVRAVAPAGDVPGEPVAPTLEEAYLALMARPGEEGGVRRAWTVQALLDLDTWRS